MAIKYLLGFFIGIISSFIYAQEQKIDSLESYFNQFYTVEFLDANNESILYTKNKTKEFPLYYLKSNNKEIPLGRIWNYQWHNNKYLIYIEKDNGMILYDIEKQIKKPIPKYQKIIQNSNNQVFVLKKEGDILYIKTVINGELGNEMKFINVLNYKLENDKLIIQSIDNKTDVYKLNENINHFIQINGDKFQSLRWNEFNQYYYIQQELEDLFYVKSDGIKIKLPNDLNNSINIKIIEANNSMLILENTIKPNFSSINSNEVEVWDTTDNQISDQRNKKQKELIFVKLDEPINNQRISISEVNYQLLGNHHLLLFDKNRYRSYRHLRDHVDVKLIDLNTMEQKLIVEDFDDYSKNKLIISEESKFIYFKENNWWIYNALNDKNECLTTSIKAEFSVENHLKNEAFQSAKLYKNTQVYLTAKEGIWEYNIHTKMKRKLIQSTKETGLFTFLETGNIGENQTNDNLYLQSINEKNDHIIYQCCNHFNQIYITQNGVKKVAEKNKNLYFTEQNYLKSPQIIQVDEKNNVTIRAEAVNSIIEKRNYQEIISTINGKKIKAILYYPLDYDSSKYYPMIVHIYQKQSHLVNNFQLPEVSSPNGFNTDFYTSQGYFVLLPDIIVDKNKPGESALQCTLKAINLAITKANIDKNKIGLMGHSYGGFEVNYILNHTKTFKAAVSGAGISDIISWYFSMDWNTLKPQFWRYEEEFFKMSSMFYDLKENYLKQSPLLQLENLSTPVLIWSGKEDYHVNWKQSVAMFLAMRILKKDGMLLLYPNEKHVIMNPAKAKDLNQRILNWFDFYLKN